MIALAAVAFQAVLVVGPQGSYASIAAALGDARPGDTVRVTAGVYHEHLVLEHPVVLLGEPGAVLTGDGRGTVLTVRARATVRGLIIKDSGTSQPAEDGGIVAAGADGLLVEDNRLENVLFGIYLKQCDDAVIRRNTVLGASLAPGRRGDGIHLWFSHRGKVVGNDVRGVRDVAIWFSDETDVTDNTVRDSRYGLHYMNSQRNRFARNAFVRNEVGAFIMYSDDITFRDNLFADARGPWGRGLGFKDADHIVAERNVIVKNAIGLSLDNSPHLEGADNRFRDNLFAYNDVAVGLLPSVHGNEFHDNRFVDNVQSVSVSGGGSALGNSWSRNYWSDYAGFDADRDGFGDTPFVQDRLSDDMMARNPELQLFNAGLAATALNTLSRVLPLLAPQPVVVDSFPRLRNARRP